MFVDVANIKIKAGDGGNGAVSFLRDKFTASGGPDGGNGGNGGDIVFVVDDNLSTLSDFRYKKKFVAQNGKNGGAGRCAGKKGDSLLIKVPRGTLIKDAKTGAIIADLSDDNPQTIAKGGKGGLGNMNFSNPTRQSPRFAKAGTKGEELEMQLELKLLADVGLIGYPNVGKSTLISVVSEAKPQVANYHFTTLEPILGVVKYDETTSFVMADIPGLIEGAWQGIGLGHKFLRHIERCRLLVHIVDISGSEGRDPIDDFNKINDELRKFNEDLSKRKMIVVGNKCDMASEEQINSFADFIKSKGLDFYPIMAAINYGVAPLMDKIAEELSKLPPISVFEPNYVKPIDEQYNVNNIKIVKDGEIYVIESKWAERLLDSVNFDDYDSMQYFQKSLIDSGIIDMLRKAGATEGCTVRIGETELDFVD